MNEKDVIQLFVDAAAAHEAVLWSDVGTRSFLFDDQRDIIFPCLFIQPLGATVANETITHSLTLYCLDLPISDIEINNQDFEWDTNAVDSRDTSLQILKDIIGKIRVENGVLLTLEVSDFVQDNEQLDGAAGWRVDLLLSQYFLTTDVGFPQPAPIILTSSDSTTFTTTNPAPANNWNILSLSTGSTLAPNNGDAWDTLNGLAILESADSSDTLRSKLSNGDTIRFYWGDGEATFTLTGTNAVGFILGNATDVVGTIGINFTNGLAYVLEAEIISTSQSLLRSIVEPDEDGFTRLN